MPANPNRRTMAPDMPEEYYPASGTLVFGAAQWTLPELGEKMHHWHSSQNDPIYAVGSMFVSNHEEWDTSPHDVGKALQEFRRMQDLGLSKCQFEDRREHELIVSALLHWLQHNPHDPETCAKCAEEE